MKHVFQTLIILITTLMASGENVCGFVNPQDIEVTLSGNMLGINFSEPQEFYANGKKYTMTEPPANIQITSEGTSFVYLVSSEMPEDNHFMLVNSSSYLSEVPTVASIIKNGSELVEVLDDIHGIEMSASTREKNDIEGAWIGQSTDADSSYYLVGFQELHYTPYRREMLNGVLVNDDKKFNINGHSYDSPMTVLYVDADEGISMIPPSPVWFESTRNFRQSVFNGLTPLVQTSVMIRIIRPDVRGAEFQHAVVMTTADISTSATESEQLKAVQMSVTETIERWYKNEAKNWKIASVYVYTNDAIKRKCDLRGYSLPEVLTKNWYKDFLKTSSDISTPVTSDGWNVINEKEYTSTIENGTFDSYSVNVSAYKMVKIMTTYHSISNNSDKLGFVRFRVKKSDGALVTGFNYYNQVNNISGGSQSISQNWSAAGFVVGNPSSITDGGGSSFETLGSSVASGIGEITLQTKASSNSDKNLSWRGEGSYETSFGVNGMYDIGGHLEMNIGSHISELEIIVKNPRDVTKVWIMGLK